MNENWVLSAGHCCAGLGDDGEIVAGTNNRQVFFYYFSSTFLKKCFSPHRFGDDDTQYRSYEPIIHPEYNSDNVDNDVCLLRLSEPLNMTNPKSVRAIPLNRRDDFESGEPFTVTGWGTLQVCHDLVTYLNQCRQYNCTNQIFSLEVVHCHRD